jgi:hypothetical protein
MSPQFVDFDADGKLDIVAGIFDGSPHLVRGTDKGWGQPEQILDKNGERIVLNAFWNFDSTPKKWDSTTKFDARGATAEAAHGKSGNSSSKSDGGEPAKPEGHITSALALDLDGDGDLDLLLGDHRSGHVYRRINEGTAQKPAFSTTNEPVTADGKPIDVPGTVATMRLVDWNGDGLLDLACGGMGDAYGNGAGGGVCVFPNTGNAKVPAFGAPVTLLEPSPKGASEPTRPDSGIYMDFADTDGDGDLDMVVGGYSYWSPKPLELTAEQQQRRDALRADIDAIDKETQAVMAEIDKQVKGLGGDEANAKRQELFKANSERFQAISKKRQDVRKELEPLDPTAKRVPYVWLYENLQRGAKSVGRK